MHKVVFGFLLIQVAFSLVSCDSILSKTYDVTFTVVGLGSTPATTADIVLQYGTKLTEPIGVNLLWTFSCKGSKDDWCDLFAISTNGSLTATIYRDDSVLATENDDTNLSVSQLRRTIRRALSRNATAWHHSGPGLSQARPSVPRKEASAPLKPTA